MNPSFSTEPQYVTALAVVIPVRNMIRWAAQSVEAAARADGVYLVVVVDDASDDGTAASIEQLAHRLEGTGPAPIQLIRQPEHQNQYAAMNRGIAEIQRNHPHIQYVAFLDADDLPVPGRFTKQLAAFADPLVVAVGGGTTEIGEDDQPLNDASLAMPVCPDPVEAGVKRFGLTLWSCTAMCRMSLFEQLGAFDWTWTRGDTEWSVRLAFWCDLTKHKAVNLQEPVNLRRIHAGQVQRNIGQERSPYCAAYTRMLQQRHVFYATLRRMGKLSEHHLHLANPELARLFR